MDGLFGKEKGQALFTKIMNSDITKRTTVQEEIRISSMTNDKKTSWLCVFHYEDELGSNTGFGATCE